MSPTVKSTAPAVVCASASAERRTNATAARTTRGFMLQPPVSPLSRAVRREFFCRVLDEDARSAPWHGRRACASNPLTGDRRSTELACEIVEQRNPHQQDEQRDEIGR